MTTIFDLLKEQKSKVEKLNKLRLEIVEEKRMRELDEANLYFQIDFKSIGATTDKLRNAANTSHTIYGISKYADNLLSL